MNKLKEQIKKTLWLKLPPKVIFPENCTTIEDRLQYRRVLEAEPWGRPRGGLLTGSPYSRVIHHCQYKFIFRELYFHTYEEDPPIRPGHAKKHPTQDILKRLAFQKLNYTRYQRMLLQSTPRNMGAVVIRNFYDKGHYAWWPIIYQANTEINRDVLAELLLGAIGSPRIKPEWRSSTVLSILRGIRADEDFSIMPIVADALEDTGCDDEHLLLRLRESSYFSLGDWLFKVMGLIG